MTQLAEWRLAYQGKVRDVYIPHQASSLQGADKLLIVATDRVSAFDVVLTPDIPGKGSCLTRISNWWMGQFPSVANHLLAEEPPKEVEDQAVVTASLSMLPVECVVRGYLVGSGWKEYQASGTICDIPLPGGLHEGDVLPEPLFTPATKAAVGDHDENISFDDVETLIGSDRAHAVRDLSLQIYREAHDIAQSRGLLLADTKMEFGTDHDGTLTLADELLTPDSSRYWDYAGYTAGGPDRLASFDKQIIRNWLQEHWDQEGSPPPLPREIVRLTQDKYSELESRLTGNEF